jgi:arylsulfatase A-like enzyme
MPKKNVLLITIDGLRYDRLSGNGYDRQTSPTLDSLAEAGGACTTAMATGTGTLLSFPGILTSSYPLMYGGYAQLTEDRVPIASEFHKQGYATLGINTNAQLHPSFGWDRGYDVYIDGEEEFINQPIGNFSKHTSGESTESPLSAVLDKLKTATFQSLNNEGIAYRSIEAVYRHIHGRSFPHLEASDVVDTTVEAVEKLPADCPSFVWVHFMETHSPYFPPEEYREQFLREQISEQKIWQLNDQLHEQPKRLTEEDVKLISDLYDASLRYLDDELNRLFKKLSVKGNTCLAVTADHGEQFREHGELTHCSQPYEEGIHVPLLFDFPKKDLSDIEAVTSTVDIAPTLLEAAMDDVGLPEKFFGRSLINPLEGKGAVPEDRIALAQLASNPRHNPRDIDPSSRTTGCRTQEWKYATSVNPEKPDLLFRLPEDPKEQHNVIDEHPEVVERFDDFLNQHYQLPAYTEYDLDLDVDMDAVEDRLKALGYVEE